MPKSETTLSRLLRERGHHLTDPVLFARARELALADETGTPEERAARHADVVAMVRAAPDVPPEPGDELP